MLKDTVILLNKIINADSYTIDDSIINEAKEVLEKEMFEDILKSVDQILRYSWSRNDIKKAVRGKNIFELCRSINGYDNFEKCIVYYLEEIGLSKLFDLLNKAIEKIEKEEEEEEENGSVK